MSTTEVESFVGVDDGDTEGAAYFAQRLAHRVFERAFDEIGVDAKSQIIDGWMRISTVAFQSRYSLADSERLSLERYLRQKWLQGHATR